jgi:hypothetical protein
MTIAAKVVKTGEFFQATAIIEDDGVQRDTYRPLEPTKQYRGSLFPGTCVGSSKNIEYSEVTHATFWGSDLEEVPSDIRLIPVRRQTTGNH